MRKPIKPSELLEMIRVSQGISGQLLLSAFKALPKVSAIRLPRALDDSDDIYPLLLTLTDAELNISMHFSPMQVTDMRRSVEEENRWHLIHPSMRLHTFGAYVVNGQPSYYAVWSPSEEPEIQVYDWPYKELRAKYDELWPQGWRLKLLSPYVLNGQVRYAAVWKPSTEGEIQGYGWLYEDFRALYDRMW